MKSVSLVSPVKFEDIKKYKGISILMLLVKNIQSGGKFDKIFSNIIGELYKDKGVNSGLF